MANHVSALKRSKQNVKARARNRAGRASNRTAVKKFLAAAAGKMPEEEFKGRQRLRIVKRMVEKR